MVKIRVNIYVEQEAVKSFHDNGVELSPVLNDFMLGYFPVKDSEVIKKRAIQQERMIAEQEANLELSRINLTSLHKKLEDIHKREAVQETKACEMRDKALVEIRNNSGKMREAFADQWSHKLREYARYLGPKSITPSALLAQALNGSAPVQVPLVEVEQS